jgi:uncharacterized protein YndB with AHSA1/START domain
MTARVDSASRIVPAPPPAVFRAFADPGALERWLPPGTMQGTMLHFDFREGGSYRMRLTYDGAHPARGKTSHDADEVDVRLTRLEDGKRIEQEVTFESEDPAFSGVMRMTWTFEAAGEGTLVTVRAEDVPPGIDPADHEAGLTSSLEGLAQFVASAR